MPTTNRYRNTTRRTNTTNRTNTTSNRTNRWNTNTNTNTPANTRRTTTMNTNYATTARAFTQPRSECQARIGSYRNVYQQFTGTQKTPFSPTNANKWIKFVNQGFRVFQWNNQDFCRHFGAQWNNNNPTTCFRWMRQKYGTTIKAVTRGRNNTWLVATSPNVAARPFNNYNWK